MGKDKIIHTISLTEQTFKYTSEDLILMFEESEYLQDVERLSIENDKGHIDDYFFTRFIFSRRYLTLHLN